MAEEFDVRVFGEYDLNPLKVLHMLHPLQSEPGDSSTTVRLGFKWAEAGEETGLFLCVCTDRCTDPELCGRAFYANVVSATPERESVGHEVLVGMPWTIDGEQIELAVWCCPNCTVEATGSIFDVWVGRFFDLPARLLQFEHEARSKTYGGLMESMRKAYPDRFTEASFVTVILYKRTT